MSKSKSQSKVLRIAARLPVVLAVFCCLPAHAEPGGDRLSIPLSDPARPATVKVKLIAGKITVKGYDGKEVIIESGDKPGEISEGEGHMKRIPMATGWSIEEENNLLQISADSPMRGGNLSLLVPFHTSLILRDVNDGISVTGVEGEIDVNTVNGSVTLKDISGNAVAHAQNGRIFVTFNRIDPQKPMAFSSLNGAIDVTFPPDLKANVTLRTDNGEAYTDFDVQMQPNAPPQVKNEEGAHGGKYRVRIDKTVHGTINGGGQDIQMTNFNGNIYLRKAGKTQ